MRGGEKIVVKEEQVTIDFAYASVVTIKEVKKGESLTADNIWVKRPGTGDFLAKDYDSLLGKKVTQNIPNNEQLQKKHFG